MTLIDMSQLIIIMGLGNSTGLLVAVVTVLPPRSSFRDGGGTCAVQSPKTRFTPKSIILGSVLK